LPSRGDFSARRGNANDCLDKDNRYRGHNSSGPRILRIQHSSAGERIVWMEAVRHRFPYRAGHAKPNSFGDKRHVECLALLLHSKEASAAANWVFDKRYDPCEFSLCEWALTKL